MGKDAKLAKTTVDTDVKQHMTDRVLLLILGY